MYTANNFPLLRKSVPGTLFFLFLFLPLSVSAQKVEKYFTSFLQPNGTLYFIETPAHFKSSDTKEKFFYDLTYLSAGDSVIVNFTVLADKPVSADSIFFGGATFPVKRIHISPKKNKWINRYTTTVPFRHLKHFFSTHQPPVIILYGENQKFTFKISPKKWRKTTAVMQKILYHIELNQLPDNSFSSKFE